MKEWLNSGPAMAGEWPGADGALACTAALSYVILRHVSHLPQHKQCTVGR